MSKPGENPENSRRDRSTLRFGPFVLDAASRRLTRGRAAIHLTPKAFDLLQALASEAQRRRPRSRGAGLARPIRCLATPRAHRHRRGARATGRPREQERDDGRKDTRDWRNYASRRRSRLRLAAWQPCIGNRAPACPPTPTRAEAGLPRTAHRTRCGELDLALTDGMASLQRGVDSPRVVSARGEADEARSRPAARWRLYGAPGASAQETTSGERLEL